MRFRPWRHPEFWPVAVLLLLWLVNALFTPNFARIEVKDGRLYGSMIDIVYRGAQVMLLAVGMAVVVATRGIDLSVGSVMAICGAVAARLLVADHTPAVAIAAALGIALALGLWNGTLVALVGMQPIVATLILLVAGRGLAQLITDGQIITFRQPAFEAIARGALLGVPFPIWLTALVAGLVWLLLRTTAIGMYVEAIGGNERAARLCGLRVGAIKLAAYVLSGLCAGVAGLVATADIRAADANNCGLYLELDAILAVVLGGTSLLGGRIRLLGALTGALIMQTITTVLLMRNVDPAYALVVKAVVAVLVCMIYTPAFSRRIARLAHSEASTA